MTISERTVMNGFKTTWTVFIFEDTNTWGKNVKGAREVEDYLVDALMAQGLASPLLPVHYSRYTTCTWNGRLLV
jgi:hypothetical protein